MNTFDSHTGAVHGPTVALATEPGQHPAAFAAAFGTGSLEAVTQFYEPGALFVPRPGEQVSGEQLAAATREFLALGLPLDVRPRHVYAVDDLALLVVDWVIEGCTAEGREVRVEGTATDVARRGSDGRWRYVIDNPFGTAPAP